MPHDQRPFDDSVRGGDPSFRVVPGHVDVSTLVESGRIGSVNRRNLSFMGSITAPGRLTKQTAPEAARLLTDAGVDVALLVPV